MKPKLGIYGDSWTQPRPPASAWGVTDTSTDNYDIADCWAWDPILADNYEITNFGNTGTDIVSYHEMFMETHNEYDAVVFIATDPNIIGYKVKEYKFYYTPDKSEKNSPVHFIRTNNRLTENDRTRVLEIYENLKGYYKYIMNINLHHAGVAGLVGEIELIRPDAVVLPTFENKYHFNKFNNFSLNHINEMEIKAFGFGKFLDDFFKNKNSRD